MRAPNPKMTRGQLDRRLARNVALFMRGARNESELKDRFAAATGVLTSVVAELAVHGLTRDSLDNWHGIISKALREQMDEWINLKEHHPGARPYND